MHEINNYNWSQKNTKAFKGPKFNLSTMYIKVTTKLKIKEFKYVSMRADWKNLPDQAGPNEQAGKKNKQNFTIKQVLIRASRLEKSRKKGVRACSSNRHTRVFSQRTIRHLIFIESNSIFEQNPLT